MKKYNCSCCDSIGYKRLKEYEIKMIDVIMVQRIMKTKIIVRNDDNIYLNMHGNKGLSKAYDMA